MTPPLVVVDADVLGRQRTGDETYMRGLLAALAADPPTDLRLAAITRHPELVPKGVEGVHLAARSQTLRMSLSVPWLLRRLRPALVHFQHALPLASPHPSVLTVHDLSFERDRTVMGLRDRLVFGTAVPRSVRRADRVLAVSELTKRDLVELYRIPQAKIVVTPNGVDPGFTPDGRSPDDNPYVLFVGALQPRKNVTAAVEALALVGDTAPRLVIAGPDKGGRTAVEDAATRLGVAVELLGYVAQDELVALYRGAACLVFPSRYEGFGLPVLEAMASGTPVVATKAGSLPEIAGDAAILVEPGNTPALAGGIERAIADHERLRAAGLERAKRYSWAETARLTLGVYRELLA
jgi:glycosyltransferase involved in cell wall biosynthesis